jgi:hypothetical protein
MKREIRWACLGALFYAFKVEELPRSIAWDVHCSLMPARAHVYQSTLVEV